MSAQEAVELFGSAEYGLLSTVGKDGQPHGVPLSYAFDHGCIYFHCALNGHKLDNIAVNSKVSFCVVGHTKVLPDQFGTEYESAMAVGVASEIFGEERYNALVLLLEKYCPDFVAEGKQYIEAKDKATRVFKVEVKQITGKAGR